MTLKMDVISRKSSVTEAATKMKTTRCRPILICDEDKPLGMVTDCDIALQVIAEGLDTKRVCVSDAASSDFVGCFRCCDGVSL